jgi:hypothetical protein
MTETQLDRFPVSELPARYSLARSATYTRLKQLDIEPEKEGKKSYVNAGQLAELDRFDDHIKTGGSITDFQTSSGQSGQLAKLQEPLSSGQLAESSGQSGQELFMLIFERLADRLSPVANPLSNLEALEQAAEKGWLLSTSQLAPLVGLNRKTLSSRRQFDRYGFTIIKAGRNGTESAWKISKKKPPNL